MINIFKDKEKLAVSFCDEIMKFNNEKDNFSLVLSGGNTPKGILKMLAKDYRKKINWEKIHLFWGDERCVPPDHEESNYGMTQKYLLDFIDIPEENVHRIKGEKNPEVEAKRYSDEIKSSLSIKNELPCFDLIMLGLGGDGHTASIFPNQSHLLTSERICEVAVHPSSNQKRITLTGKVINNSKRIIFLVAGKSKAEILKKIIDEKNKIYPAEFIEPVDGDLDYFIDSDAAELLDIN
jgi:6-phosphogluconolactonase